MQSDQKLFHWISGVGIGMVIVSGLVCVYYNVIVAWTIYYLFMSFRAVLPWSTCGNWWNTENCVDVERSVNMAGNNSQATNLTGLLGVNGTSLLSNTSAMMNYSVIGTSMVNGSLVGANGSLIPGKTDLISSSEEFWEWVIIFNIIIVLKKYHNDLIYKLFFL